MRTKLSVIIPTYLEEKLLGNLLAKFDKDTKDKYGVELIVSDGGSTDNTLTIASQYADTIVTRTSESPQNIAKGRNSGAAVANGDVLVFLNADCIPLDMETFFTIISNWRDNRTSDAIACKVRAFGNEEILRDKIFYILHNNYVRLLNAMGVGMGRGECQIIDRKIFEKVGGYNNELAAGEDFDLYRRIVKAKGKIKYEPRIVINESPRRFRKYGYIKTLYYWTINSITVMLWNTSASKEWEAIR